MRKTALLLASVFLALLLACGAATALSGRLDHSFGGDGKVVTNFGGTDWEWTNDYISDMVLQPDNKLVAVGTTRDADYDIALARYNPDGSLDSSFGKGGKVITDIGGTDADALTDKASALVLQPDNKLVVAGSEDGDFVLVRYNPDGSLDTSFGDRGVATTDFGGIDPSSDSVHDGAEDLVLQDDGKLVAAGSSDFDVRGGGNTKFSLARYNPDGSLDKSFGRGGKVLTRFFDFSFATSLALRPDGKLVAAGSTEDPSGSLNFASVQYNPDGSPDTSFSGDGKVMTDLGGIVDIVQNLAVRPDGKLIAMGSSRKIEDDSPIYRTALVRYNPNGGLDRSFGEGGKVLTIARQSSSGSDLLLLADGNLIVAGTSYGKGSNSDADFTLIGYKPGGSLDTSFGEGGKVFTGIRGSDHAAALVLQPNGRLVAGGSTNQYFGLVRYRAR